MEEQFKLNAGICPNFRSLNNREENVVTVENILSEAISSGLGVVCFSPDLSKSTNHTETLKSFINLIVLAEAGLHQTVKGYVWASLTDSNHNEIVDILDKHKVIGVRVRLSKKTESDESVGIKSWDSLEKLLWMMKQKRINKPISIFQEEESEVCTLERLVKYAERYPDFRYMAGQVTSAKGIKIITDAQKTGLKIMIELTPYHLSFNNGSKVDGVYLGYKTPNEDNDFLREFLKLEPDNPLVCIGSDSVPDPTKKMGRINTMQHIVKSVLNLSDKLCLSASAISNITSNNIAVFLGIPLMKENCLWECDPHPDNVKYSKGDIPNTFAGVPMYYKLSKRELV